MINSNDQRFRELLCEEWRMLIGSLETLNRSIDKCKSIGKKKSYSFEELESFDSLTSKFNRTSDLFTQKTIRTIWMLLHEPFLPFIDMMNQGEKMRIISSADQMIRIRDLRNQIAHEYIPEAIQELVPEVYELTSQLTENINCCRDYLESRKWINLKSE